MTARLPEVVRGSCDGEFAALRQCFAKEVRLMRTRMRRKRVVNAKVV